MYLYVDCLWIVLSMQYVFMHIGSMICKKIDVLGGIYSETGEFPISSCPSQDLIVAYDTNKYRKEYETYVKARPSQGWSCWISWWSFGR